MESCLVEGDDYRGTDGPLKLEWGARESWSALFSELVGQLCKVPFVDSDRLVKN